jgi:hypothetical protein
MYLFLHGDVIPKREDKTSNVHGGCYGHGLVAHCTLCSLRMVCCFYPQIALR